MGQAKQRGTLEARTNAAKSKAIGAPYNINRNIQARPSGTMDLADILPFDSLKTRFNSNAQFIRKDTSDYSEISTKKYGSWFEIASGGWHGYVQINQIEDFVLGSEFMPHNKEAYQIAENRIGQPIIEDILYSTVNIIDDSQNDTEVCELLLVKTFPNALRISDVAFQNIYRPIPDSPYTYQIFEGLNLFGELIANCEDYCRDHGLDKILLTAAARDLVPFFERFGFAMEDNDFTKHSYNVAKMSIPMYKLIDIN